MTCGGLDVEKSWNAIHTKQIFNAKWDKHTKDKLLALVVTILVDVDVYVCSDKIDEPDIWYNRSAR